MKRLTREEIRFLVGQVIAGELRPLDQILTKAIFGDDAPDKWGDWPEEAVKAWSFGCDLYQKNRRLLFLRHDIVPIPLTVDLSWQIILGLAPDPTQWWFLPGVTWAHVGYRLGMTPRRASYRMTNLGWRMAGAGMGVPDRKVVAAPCEVCGAVWTPREIDARWGPCCLENR